MKTDIGKIEIQMKVDLSRPVLAQLRIKVGVWIVKLGAFLINGEN